MDDFSPEVNHALDSASRIKRADTIVLVAVLFGLSVFSLVARVALKLFDRRRFALDDYLMFFGIACLSTGVGIFYSGLDNLYLGTALVVNPLLIAELPPDSFRIFLSWNLNARLSSAVILFWTTTFCVKYSFLAFFHRIVKPIKELKLFWWFTLVITSLVWILLIMYPFIMCPYYNTAALKCFDANYEKRFKILQSLGTVLDILTDVMIVSIPILALRKTTMILRQKLAIGIFLCLSVVMIILAIIRSLSLPGPVSRARDVPWTILWVYLESAVAVIMVSLTAFRTLFTLRREERRQREERLKWSPNTWKDVAMPWRKEAWTSSIESDTEQGLPEIPNATLTGMRTAIWGGKDDATRPEDTARRSVIVGTIVARSVSPWETPAEWVDREQRRSQI
ncbi:hypothetical protein BS50DRAFT_578420 [Corynespora cassiicola Philippines]|uniref:Rhodopsin domain-containing protein n=1 Tax=Corynespora cassiicola Philippines TaxID=1448308 RepID=A0A2T2N7J8_CORCC|nr:hypothetical protein BS50DRAFT_578420 [Corynespora cassiicola Philippines]